MRHATFSEFLTRGGYQKNQQRRWSIIAKSKPFYQQNDGELSTEPPKYLGTIAKLIWRKIVPFLQKNTVAKRVDIGLVESYCTQYEIYRSAYDSIVTDGIQTPIYKSLQDSTGKVIKRDFVGYKRNPATSVFNDALKQLSTIGSELGLSPKSRAEMKKIAEPKGNNVEQDLKKFM